MYNNTLAKLDSQAKQKHGLFGSSPLRYFLAAMLAGAYVGVGSIVLFLSAIRSIKLAHHFYLS